MADHHHHHHHLHRPHHLSLPSRPSTTTASTPRPYPLYPYAYPPLTPTPTPSKHRLSKSTNTKTLSLSFLLLLLFSLRSLYSLLPFLRSSPPSFSLFPFSFLVSLLSFLLTLSFSFFPLKQNQPTFSLASITPSQHRLLVLKSFLLATVFLLRFQALRYCGTAAMILAELSGNVAARFLAEGRSRLLMNRDRVGSSKVRGFCILLTGLFLLSVSWDRIECFPLSLVNVEKLGFTILPGESCVRFWPMLLPFLSGFLGCYERVSMNWGSVRELGRKRAQLISLFFTTVVLFIPAVVSMFVYEAQGVGVSVENLGWPLANTVVFGVLLSETFTDDKLATSKDFQREYFVTFVCTLVLELFYFPELSLWGLLICGFLIGIAVRELDPVYSNYLELGLESSDSFTTSIMKPVRHILSERKSRKIALFLLINTGYMVVEFVAGFMSNSLGLISDACHMLFDCAALAIGLYASYISRLPANTEYNYGRGRFEVLSGYVNAVFLVLVGALIVLESIERILDPQEISTSSLMAVSIGGLLVNVVGLIFFHDEHHHAHGGSGSCSHSHSHSHTHSNSDHHHHQHSQDHVGHDEKVHSKQHQECITVIHDSYGKSGPEDQCCASHKHNGSDHHQSGIKESNKGKGALRHGHQHHDHGHQHDHDDHGHQHDHRDHGRQHDHRDHGHQHDHHDHEHHHSRDHHAHHQHDHHDHGHQHDHHDHDDEHHHHHDHHAHGNIPVISHSQANESHMVRDSHALCDNHSHGHVEPSRERDASQKQHHHHHHIDHNMEGIFLHVLADTLGSVGVVISTLLIQYKGWLVADPACSIFISILIVSSVIPLLRNSAEILLQRIPRAHEGDLKEALNDVMRIKGVCGIQNLHVWSFTNTDVVGTLHLHVSAEMDKAFAKAQVSDILCDAGIKDLTVQIEQSSCALIQVSRWRHRSSLGLMDQEMAKEQGNEVLPLLQWFSDRKNFDYTRHL
ncbi:hypothetical protein RJ639_021443 [Escallonia herrerae]|uniref:Cation efflux protein transmembrane domain-containing protein n=1 Tax=Escallonia herrerae TaxID=1293975 RepID=A0AA88V6S0_9ASTE|nr:hypothetical protein RJ639_021443 [Escallonia herrerae]